MHLVGHNQAHSVKCQAADSRAYKKTHTFYYTYPPHTYTHTYEEIRSYDLYAFIYVMYVYM